MLVDRGEQGRQSEQGPLILLFEGFGPRQSRLVAKAVWYLCTDVLSRVGASAS